MDMIPRTLNNTILKEQKKGFLNLIYGPRRVGKTVLLQQLTKSIEPDKIIWFDGDTQEARNSLSNTSLTLLSKLVKNYQYIVIDEAQRIPNIGLSLKIINDRFPEKIFYITGSSSLMLSRGLQETLTGRTKKYRLFPLSTKELGLNLKQYQIPSLLANQLLYGGYPYLEQTSQSKEKVNYLKSLVDDYLFKDVLELKELDNPDNLRKLTMLLAWQIGNEVSLNELANNLRIDIKTVKRYLTLLEQSFVIFGLGAFSRNLRKEVVKSKKYYFWDLGIRNAIIDQFLELDTRPDQGQLWENFLAVERLKKDEYAVKAGSYYFWRTYDQAEIDWIEYRGGKISAYEFKWKKKTNHTPKAFKNTYKATVKIINRDNYLTFIL